MKQVPCEIYTRTVGYFRPVHCMNAGKKEEVADRKLAATETVLKSLQTQ